MKNVTINKQRFDVVGDEPVKLNNGGLVLHYNKLGNVMGAYIVTSFRGESRSNAPTSTYCSLVDLDTGYIKFEERCSRTTNIRRVLSHLNPNDYEAKTAIKDGQYLEVYRVGDYNIDIQTNTKKVGE